jgi:peptide/nickel transport system permease protein
MVTVLVGVLILVFIMTHSVGDPVRLMLPAEATYQDYLQLQHQLGLDRPIQEQFISFLLGAAHGDFGLSIWQQRPAMDIVLEWLPASLILSVCAMVLALVVSVPLGILASFRPMSFFSRAIASISVIGVTVPIFWLGIMLILLLSLRFPLFPTSGYGTWQHLVLPTITLAALPAGRITQMVRSSMLQEVAQQYTITARAKGLEEKTIIVRHMLKNAAIPIVTLTGFELGRMLAGNTIVLETVFAWPGIGLLMMNAIFHRDLPLIAAGVFVVAVIVVLLNILTDITYGFLDPRIRAK